MVDLEGGSPAEALLERLDPEQRAVATTLDGPLAVIAGAGTGKTRAITHRIAYGVAIGRYVPTAVLAVTFTTRAAGELRGRLQQLGARGVQARTFHSAALRQAQYFWPRVHGGELPAVLDNRMSLVAESAHRLRIPVDTARLRDLVSEISWAKVSNTSAEDYPRIAAAGDRRIASMDSETIARVFAGYEAAKRDRGRIDFEDILLCAAGLLSEHPDIRSEVHRTYRHLVVDEYQDVSPLQQALLDLWAGERSDLCVVGDPAQTIHSFAGARANYLTGFAARHRNATVIRLVRDYRSTPQVVRSANAIMKTAPGGGMTAVTLQAQRSAGPDPLLVEAADEASEAAAVADWIVALATDGVPYREMAVLFRINAQSPLVEQALADRKIPYLVRGGERFYERPEVRQALHALRNHVRSADPGSGSGVEEMQGVLGALGWTPQPPQGAGAVRERWESLAALLSVAEDLPGTDGQRGTAGLVDVVAELEPARRRPARADGPGRDGVDAALGQGPGVGRGGVDRLPGGQPAVRPGHQPRPDRRGTPPAVRRDHSRPRAPADLLGAHSARRRYGAQAVPLPGSGAAGIRTPGGIGAPTVAEPRIAALAAVPDVWASAGGRRRTQDRPARRLPRHL